MGIDLRHPPATSFKQRQRCEVKLRCSCDQKLHRTMCWSGDSNLRHLSYKSDTITTQPLGRIKA